MDARDRQIETLRLQMEALKAQVELLHHKETMNTTGKPSGRMKRKTKADNNPTIPSQSQPCIASLPAVTKRRVPIKRNKKCDDAKTATSNSTETTAPITQSKSPFQVCIFCNNSFFLHAQTIILFIRFNRPMLPCLQSIIKQNLKRQ
jgi:hypothetical protein